MGQRRSKYRSNLGQTYLFGNIITVHGYFEMKLGQYVYFHGIYKKIPRFIQIWLFWTQFGKRRSIYLPNVGQNYLFRNSFNNFGKIEQKLGQYLYFHGLNQKSKRLFQTWLFFTEFWLKKVQMIWAIFGAKLLFGNCFTN